MRETPHASRRTKALAHRHSESPDADQGSEEMEGTLTSALQRVAPIAASARLRSLWKPPSPLPLSLSLSPRALARSARVSLSLGFRVPSMWHQPCVTLAVHGSSQPPRGSSGDNRAVRIRGGHQPMHYQSHANVPSLHGQGCREHREEPRLRPRPPGALRPLPQRSPPSPICRSCLSVLECAPSPGGLRRGHKSASFHEHAGCPPAPFN